MKNRSVFIISCGIISPFDNVLDTFRVFWAHILVNMLGFCTFAVLVANGASNSFQILY